MRGQVDYLYDYVLRLNHTNDSILTTQSRRPVALPFPAQRFVIETPDLAKPLKPRQRHDIFPFLISLQDFEGKLG